MPASSSEARTRWRKRKREPLITRKPKPQDDDEEDEEEDEDVDLHQQSEFDEDPHQPGPYKPSDPGPIAREREVLADRGVRICDFPPVVKRTVNRPHSSVLAILAMERAVKSGEIGKQLQQQDCFILENVSYGQLQALSAVPADSPALAAEERADGAAFVITPPPVVEGRGVVKRFWGNRPHVVPMHADWFSPNTVHRLERQVVPHFFSGKSPDHTPEKYMECRNCIVAIYMENPDKRVSVSDCKGLVVGVDIDDMTRIVRFLDHWGIINYCAAATNHEPRNDGPYLSEDPNCELHVPVVALKSIDSLIQFDKPKCSLKVEDVYPELECHDDKDIITELECRIQEDLSENRCNCCSRTLPVLYYQSQKEVDIQLCFNCFHEGRFVIGHSSLDFIRVDSMKSYRDMDGENWTNNEIVRLLEGVQLYKGNWNEIAEHVRSKSKTQCMNQFVSLHVEDTPLEKVEVPSMPVLPNLLNSDFCGGSDSNLNGDLAGSSLQDPDSESSFPFRNCGNPVMYLVSFLASAVGPRVAAACAHASLAVLSEEDGSAAYRKSVQMEGSGCSRTSLESTIGGQGGSHRELMNSSQQRGLQGPWNQHDAEGTPLSAEKVRAAAKAGYAAAAMKAKLFADHEEREIQRLSANIINYQLKRLELKLKQFAEVETVLMKECEQVERARQRLAAERAHMISAQFGPATGMTRPMGLQGVGASMVNNNTGNNRQQVVSGSPSQPFISGYGNNQPIQHPHMSLMPQQPMYGLGQRLPLSAIHPSSSSAPSNAMFNAAANAQSAVSHPMLRPVSRTNSGLGIQRTKSGLG